MNELTETVESLTTTGVANRRWRAAEVAIVCRGDEVYGIGSVIKLYAEQMPEALFLCREEGVLTEQLRSGGNRVRVIGEAWQFVPRSSVGTLLALPGVSRRAKQTAKRILGLLRNEGIRIFHAPVLADHLVGAHLRKYGIKSVWHIHNNTSRERLWGMGVRLNHLLARWGADMVIGVSDFISSNWRGSGKPVVTVHNAAQQFYSAPNVLAGPPYRCVIAGRLEESKGHHLAVEAVIMARKQGIDVRLDVFGGPLLDNPYFDRLRARVTETGNSEFVVFRGFVKQLRLEHQKYHLGLQCRIDPEPCSVWVCEALVDGLPLLASATGGTPELVEEGVTGRLFATGNQDEISKKLIEILRMPVSLTAMREAAYATGKWRLSPNRLVSETLLAYERLSD